jgi:fatty acid synthase
MSETHGRGVDLVLNSLAEEKLQASLRCLGPRGRFLEIGISDLQKNNTIGMINVVLLIPLSLLTHPDLPY